MSPALPKTFRAAVIQLCSGNDRAANLDNAARLLAEAAGQGAGLALLPENFAFIGDNDREKRQTAEAVDSSVTLRFLAEQARRHRLAIIGGTVALADEATAHIRNASPLFLPDGSCIATYDKMHLFDVELPNERYSESSLVHAGDSPVTATLGEWKIGLSVCYDLRFPELYRHYSAAGCNLLSVPSAFTVPTGEAHWRTLLRARAIENQCYLLAAGQSGTHPGGRRTWGHSMIVDPWGTVIAALEDQEEGLVIAELQLEFLQRIRTSMPVLQHRRM